MGFAHSFSVDVLLLSIGTELVWLLVGTRFADASAFRQLVTTSPAMKRDDEEDLCTHILR